jgi:hypothetical protein
MLRSVFHLWKKRKNFFFTLIADVYIWKLSTAKKSSLEYCTSRMAFMVMLVGVVLVENYHVSSFSFSLSFLFIIIQIQHELGSRELERAREKKNKFSIFLYAHSIFLSKRRRTTIAATLWSISSLCCFLFNREKE